MSQAVRIGTRKSLLALKQAQIASDELKKIGLTSEFVTIETSGDKFLNESLEKIGGKGLFLKEIEAALLSKKIDIAVHSLKDVPSVIPQDLTLAAYFPREDPRDVWIASHPDNAHPFSNKSLHVGTSSNRRKMQLLAHQSSHSCSLLRGNVDTRLKKLDDGQYNAIILAAAGLNRLNINRTHTYVFSLDEMIPSVGQGAIVIETLRTSPINTLISTINHSETEECVTLERKVQAFVGGNCFIPFGAHFEKAGEEIIGRVFLMHEDREEILKIKKTGRWENQHDLLEKIKKEVSAFLER